MKHKRSIFLAVMIGLLITACSRSSAKTNSSANELSIDVAMSKIHLGMNEKDLLSVIKPIALKTGVVYWGGSGAHRLYFQVEKHSQFWVEIGSMDKSIVTSIGPLEPMGVWKYNVDGSLMAVQLPVLVPNKIQAQDATHLRG